MHFRRALLCVALLSAGSANASDTAASKEEFDRITAAPFKAIHMTKEGFVVQLHLKQDGYAVASLSHNDVGSWRRNGDAGYCVRWNKRRFEDRCTSFVKRDGKLAATAPDGAVEWWIESVQ